MVQSDSGVEYKRQQTSQMNKPNQTKQVDTENRAWIPEGEKWGEGRTK